MSVFEQCFLFLRNPRGGVEGLAEMKAAGFGGVFCNIGDYPPEAWEEIVLPRARGLGMFCGPWLRTADEHNRFDYGRLDRLVFCADDWASPLIVNSEKELDGSGSNLTEEIAETVGGREAAVSVLPIPMDTVHYTPIAHLPVLPQIFPPDQGHVVMDVNAVRELWHRYGVRCVYMTYATYGGMTPEAYPLQAPYSLYTGDDCGNVFDRWKPTSTGWNGCVEDVLPPVPPDGGDMEKIGKQHGVTAAVNRLRTLDPEGTLLVADSFTGKWPSIDTLSETPIDQWKAYDKLERSLTILVEDHDAAAVFADEPD